VKSLIGVKTEELTYDLDGEDLRVAESFGAGPRLRRGPRYLSWSSTKQKTEKTMKVLRSTARDLLLASVGLGTTERREVSIVIQPFGETCTRG
jgi:hypothetical protein